MDDYYIRKKSLIKEETNDEGETTYFIEGEISKNGDHWEECQIIWSEELGEDQTSNVHGDNDRITKDN